MLQNRRANLISCYEAMVANPDEHITFVEWALLIGALHPGYSQARCWLMWCVLDSKERGYVRMSHARTGHVDPWPCFPCLFPRPFRRLIVPPVASFPLFLLLFFPPIPFCCPPILANAPLAVVDPIGPWPCGLCAAAGPSFLAAVPLGVPARPPARP